MFVNVTIKIDEQSFDIKINSQQKIKNALAILRQSGKVPQGETPDYTRSMLTQSLVSTHKTFAEEGIFDGDKLVFHSQNNQT